MIKKMIARYPGRCARSGAPIYPGDEVFYNTVTRQVSITPDDDAKSYRRAFVANKVPAYISEKPYV